MQLPPDDAVVMVSGPRADPCAQAALLGSELPGTGAACAGAGGRWLPIARWGGRMTGMLPVLAAASPAGGGAGGAADEGDTSLPELEAVFAPRATMVRRDLIPPEDERDDDGAPLPPRPTASWRARAPSGPGPRRGCPVTRPPEHLPSPSTPGAPEDPSLHRGVSKSRDRGGTVVPSCRVGRDDQRARPPRPNARTGFRQFERSERDRPDRDCGSCNLRHFDRGPAGVRSSSRGPSAPRARPLCAVHRTTGTPHPAGRSLVREIHEGERSPTGCAGSSASGPRTRWEGGT